MTAILAMVFCTIMVNVIWLATLCSPKIPLHYSIVTTVLLSSFATILAVWVAVP